MQKDLRSDLLLEIELDSEPYYANHYGEVMEFAKKVRSHQLSELRSNSGSAKTIEVVLPAFICVLFARFRDFGGVKAIKELLKNIKKRYDDELGCGIMGVGADMKAGTLKETIFDQLLKPSKDMSSSDNLFNHANLVEDLCVHVLRSADASLTDYENMKREIHFEQLNANANGEHMFLDVDED